MKEQYNPSQMEAIRHFHGPCMALAGPGSGKTAVITERTKNLIEEHRVNPANILVITFTKAAAGEMRERFLALMGKGSYPVTFGTFHAVFFGILRNAYHYSASNIIREEQRYALIKELLQKKRLEYEDENEFVNEIGAEIASVKSAGISLSHYYSANCAAEAFRGIYAGYQEYLDKNRLLDFEDMIVYTYELFQARKDILAAWQNKFRYILIDEFQDIDRMQYEIVRMMAEPGNNLFAVGDDDQSIYRFRGAKPEIMLHFFEDYPEGKRILLDTNYRSQEKIVDASSNLISYNRERYEKEIRACHAPGADVEYALFSDAAEENERIVRDIMEHRERGGGYQDIAVLFRTNTQPRMLMEYMMSCGIPFYARDAIPNLYDHWIAQDIFAYLRIAAGSRQRSDFLRIMNRPKRYIGRESLEEELVAFDAWRWFYEEEKPWVAERIDKLEADIGRLSRMAPYAAVNYIRRGIGYDGFLAEYADYRRMRAEDLLDVIEELHEAARGHKTFEEWSEHREAYEKELKDMRQRQTLKREGVTLATLHGAKGLEYDTVYLIDVNEGVMPYKKAVLEEEIEEERRMFYVGMTRAKKNLHIFSVKQINRKNAEVSRFVEESKKACPHISSNSASSSSSSKRSATASYSSSSEMLSKTGTPSPSSE